MLTHVHKVIHLVVGIFEQGLETSSAECPLIQERQGFIEWTGRWSRLDRRVRSVVAEGVRFGLMTGRWVAQRPDAGGRVWSYCWAAHRG